jgi:hypothetical protein
MAETKFISWSYEFKKTHFQHFLSYHDLTLLHVLAPTYHSGFGYDIDEIMPDPDMDFVYRSNLVPNLVIAHEDEYVLIDPRVAKIFSCSHALRHKIITVRLGAEGQQEWMHKPNKVYKTCFHKRITTPKYWYEFPAEKFKSPRGTCDLVGPLCDRIYIHVIDPFDEIEIRSEEKGSPITIDDVLFACRGICADDARSIQGFNILMDDGSKLVLKADIDNWSS